MALREILTGVQRTKRPEPPPPGEPLKGEAGGGPGLQDGGSHLGTDASRGARPCCGVTQTQKTPDAESAQIISQGPGSSGCLESGTGCPRPLGVGSVRDPGETSDPPARDATGGGGRARGPGRDRRRLWAPGISWAGDRGPGSKPSRLCWLLAGSTGACELGHKRNHRR